ncbi:hypothetical protein [Prosthecomicrobium hirschii]|uniref:hypothetical protein n=1 Tax=Prosthecodimorpha hirschii TaxID=665126 RepID=UPI00221EB9E5|nr:hypothetical protein [Prosthecomicrobium hirschii]MCW1842269.1 hypothetical protein [Prosthecomicrobium hirschii]
MSIILALKVDKSRPLRRGAAYVWSVIRELTAGPDGTDRPVTLRQIVLRTDDVAESTLRGFMRTLAGAGIVEPVPGSVRQWRVLKRPTQLPPLTRNGQRVTLKTQQMWNAIRALPSFTAAEVAVAASIEDSVVQVNTAKTYIKLLNAAGYLKIEKPAAPPMVAAVYRLRPSMNTGPLPPKILRTKLVYDPNRNEIVGPAEAEEVSC